ncbi:hypothetical protein PY093_14635 [Cytobacillus sp. S13-E01]|uniref:hypothetical protein n=1 Tax=Cytobacillus sp. S13-E01 TaxID=3031326 RepID=UPI0023D86737|nr:hypothetical protein [Cytobacillus sp. S13-E01]MDF0727911.1 hypothetical protein [Cytobacillus sp. S13-E01]
MYRCKLNGQEVIIRLSSKVEKLDIDKSSLYRKVAGLEEVLIDLVDKEDIALVDKDHGIIVIESNLIEMPIITIQHIIQKEYVFD